MDTVTFDKLLLKTAFCCMASDGNIDKREISLIQSMCEKSSFFKNVDTYEEINILITSINSTGKLFIQQYFDLLQKNKLTEEEELTIIDFAIHTIYADEQIEYSEIKFFKNIRHRLQISDERILQHFPNIEQFLEKDIITDSFLDKITNQYFETTELPYFDLIKIDSNSLDTITGE